MFNMNHARSMSHKMKQIAIFPMVGIISLIMTMFLIVPITTVAKEKDSSHDQKELLAGERVIKGTVEEIRGEQAKVDIGENQPRFIPMNLRKDKGLPALKKGDHVKITVNDQNLVVDVHLSGEKSHHRIVHGMLAQPMATGHERAIIRTKDHQEESHPVGPLARSKVASIPVGKAAVFLIDENNTIMDVTYGDQAEIEKAQELWSKKSPPKSSFKRINGTLKEPLKKNMIMVQEDGEKAQQYEVRPLIKEKIAKLSAGQSVIIFVDDENKVTDVSFEDKG